MAPNDLVEDLRRQPFGPFCIHVVDGAKFDIYHPDQCIVQLASVLVGVYPKADAPYAERTVKLDVRLISRIEPLTAALAPSGGTDYGD